MSPPLEAGWVLNTSYNNSISILTASFNGTAAEELSNKVIVFVLFIHVFAAFALIGNAAVIYLFATTEIRQRNIYYYFVINLSISDLLVGLAFILTLASVYVRELRQFWHCPLSLCLINVLVVVSLGQTFVISIDQYIAVRLPHRHRQIMNAQRAKASILLVWLYSAALGVIPFILWSRGSEGQTICEISTVFPTNTQNYFRAITIGYTPLFLLATAFCFALLSTVSRRTTTTTTSSTWQPGNYQQRHCQHQQQNAANHAQSCWRRNASRRHVEQDAEHSTSSTFEMSSVDTDKTAPSLVVDAGAPSINHLKTEDTSGNKKSDARNGDAGRCSNGQLVMVKQMQKQSAMHRSRTYRKATITLTIVVVFFLVCLTPSLIQSFHSSFTNSSRLSSMRMVGTLLVCVNSAVNPAIYALRMSKLRGRICRCIRQRLPARRDLYSTESART
uniref:probable G-protein coupled receptor No9 n=1 Tax=Myxine glutinosa TaxID=7769 RepID=UPI00358FBF64